MAQQATGDESAVLRSSLDGQRLHVLGILEGLPDEALRRPVLPSGWTCVGLIQHLALDVERFWFRAIVAGEPISSGDSSDAEDAWQVPADVSAEAVFDLYRDEVARANAILDDVSLDAAPTWWPVEQWPDWRLDNVRQILVHVVTETACHAGHLDAARELIDGRTWMVL